MDDARAMVSRAVDKAEQLGVRGSIAVVGASGTLISASRLDFGGPGGMGRAVSKAWISGTQQLASGVHKDRIAAAPAIMAWGFMQVSPESVFPGGGGMQILTESGEILGGIAASGATVSPFLPAGVAPELVSAEGSPANPEDLIISYALGGPYVGQHGDDTILWKDRFGDLVVPAEDSLGMKPAPTASHQPELLWAKEVCDHVLTLAASRGLEVATVVVDRGGDPIQQDHMDGAVAAATHVAGAVSRAAARHGMPSHRLADLYGGQAFALATLHPHRELYVGGGVPLTRDGQVVAGLGVGGIEPEEAARLVADATS
ncbi:heme-binding protein [Angustibacter luteus]|uniref:Heme-binding protein n=1 Tax=Angustibacter luteus TaxID=658456 RepID=A0ABW1JEY5_9ACTN